MASIVLRADERGVDPLVAFCAKEAPYMAWSHPCGGLLEHAYVRFELGRTRFSAWVVASGTRIDGGWAGIAGRCLTVAVLGGVPSPVVPGSGDRCREGRN